MFFTPEQQFSGTCPGQFLGRILPEKRQGSPNIAAGRGRVQGRGKILFAQLLPRLHK